MKNQKKVSKKVLVDSLHSLMPQMAQASSDRRLPPCAEQDEAVEPRVRADAAAGPVHRAALGVQPDGQGARGEVVALGQGPKRLGKCIPNLRGNCQPSAWPGEPDLPTPLPPNRPPPANGPKFQK